MSSLVALPGFPMRGELPVRAADLLARVLLAMGMRLRPNPCSAKTQRCFCSFMVPSYGLILLASIFNVWGFFFIEQGETGALQSSCMSSPLQRFSTAMSLQEHFALQYGSRGHQLVGWHSWGGLSLGAGLPVVLAWLVMSSSSLQRWSRTSCAASARCCESWMGTTPPASATEVRRTPGVAPGGQQPLSLALPHCSIAWPQTPHHAPLSDNARVRGTRGGLTSLALLCLS